MRLYKTGTLFLGLLLCTIILISKGQDCCIKNTIKTQGLGETRIKPNIGYIYASVGAAGSTVTNVLKSIDLTLDWIAYELKQIKIASNDVATGSLSFYPRYNFTDNKNTLIGYSVYVSLTITVRGIENNSTRIAQVIDVLDYAGVRSITGITYDTQDPNSGKATARNNAYNDAIAKAKQHAQLIGRKLGKAIMVEETSLLYSPYYYSTPPSGLRTLYTPTSQQAQKSAAAASGGIASAALASGAAPSPSFPAIPIGTILVTVLSVVTWQLI